MVLVEFNSSIERLPRTGGEAQAEIFSRVDRPGALLVYSFSTPSGGSGHAIHAEMLFTGGSHGRRAGDHLFCVGLPVPFDFREEFLAWYKIEHLPILLRCPDWDGCRFVEARSEEGCQFYALHQLKSAVALDSPERKASRSTPWFRRLAQHNWFDTPFTRTSYRRID